MRSLGAKPLPQTLAVLSGTPIKKMLGGRKSLPRSSGLVLVFGLFFTSPVAQLFLSFDPCCILLLPAESQLAAVPCWFPPAVF